MGRFGWFWGLLSVSLSSLPVSADSGQDPVELGSVLVSPRRIPGLVVSESRYPGNATVITADAIRASGSSTIQEVIARAEGMTFSDQQGFGLSSDGTLNIRGIVNSSRSNVLVLVDGVRQNRLTGDEVHWQAIPVSQIERLEIIRGGGGVIYGEGALGGVINIITKQAGNRLLETEYGGEAGSFGWQQHTLSARGRADALSYGMNVSRRVIDGYRESSWSRNTTLTAHAGWDGARLFTADFHLLHSEDATAFPGSLTLAQTEQRRVQPNAFHGFNMNELDQFSLDLIGGPWGGWSSVVNLFWKRWLQTSEDSIQFNSFTSTPSRGLSVRTNYEWAGDVADNLLVSGFELLDDKATTGDRDSLPGADSESHRKGYGLYLEDTVTGWERLSLTAGLRFDKSRYEESLVFPAYTGTLRFEGWSPKLAIGYAAVPGTLQGFASYARPFKAPNVDDLSARTPTFSGNADLQPQQADTYELGVKLLRPSWNANATWFFTRIDDEILVNGLTSMNDNFDTRRAGVEAALRWELPRPRLRGQAAYTFVDAKFTKGPFSDNTIPGTPEHTVTASLGFSPLQGLWVDLAWQLVQDFYRINDMENRLGGADNYGVLGLTLQYALPERLHPRRWPDVMAYLKIDNLTNEEYAAFQSSNGSNLNGAGEYPMPPTSLTGGVTITF